MSDGCIAHEDEPTGRLSVSVGIGFVERPAMADKGPLQEAADAALYDAKRSGRGRSAVRTIGRSEPATP